VRALTHPQRNAGWCEHIRRVQVASVERDDLERRSDAALPAAIPPLGTNSARARVLVLLARGLNNGELAERLTLSEATVKTHAARILSKLAPPDRVQAVVLAYESRLVAPGPDMKRVGNGYIGAVTHTTATIVDQLRSLELHEPGAAAADVYDKPIELRL